MLGVVDNTRPFTLSALPDVAAHLTAAGFTEAPHLHQALALAEEAASSSVPSGATTGWPGAAGPARTSTWCTVSAAWRCGAGGGAARLWRSWFHG